MHNKLFVGDNAIAVTGGRNIGDEYFQASTALEFGDFDLAVAGPMVRELSRTFDLFWNDRLAIPVEAQPLGKPSAADLDACRAALARCTRRRWRPRCTCARCAKGDLLQDILSGKQPLVWAKASLAYDSPDKASTVNGDQPGQLMWRRVAAAAEVGQVRSHHRLALSRPGQLRDGADPAAARARRARADPHEFARLDRHADRPRRLPALPRAAAAKWASSSTRCAGSWANRRRIAGRIKSGSSGAFALHAKVFVIDRERAFVGSMNFDQRSLRINTELGLIIDSPQIAREIAARFDAITQPANSYRLDPRARRRRRGRRADPVASASTGRQRGHARHRAGRQGGQAQLDRHAVAAAARRPAVGVARVARRAGSDRVNRP